MKKIFTILSIAAVSMISAQNLVTNGDFETGSIDPWVKGGTAASYGLPTLFNTGAHGGTYYAGYMGATGTTGFSQDIGISGGTSYTISFWYKAIGDGTDARIWSVFKDAAGGILYLAGDNTTTATGAQIDPLRGPYNLYLTPANDWTQYSFTFTSPAAATIFQLSVRAYNNSTNVSYDDFSLVGGTAAVEGVAVSKHALVKNTLVKDALVFATKSDIQIINMNGQVVKTASVDNNSTLDLSALPKGTYIVKGIANGEGSVQKINKQ